MISVGGNLYSVPNVTRRRPLEVHTTAGEVCILEDVTLGGFGVLDHDVAAVGRKVDHHRRGAHECLAPGFLAQGVQVVDVAQHEVAADGGAPPDGQGIVFVLQRAARRDMGGGYFGRHFPYPRHGRPETWPGNHAGVSASTVPRPMTGPRSTAHRGTGYAPAGDEPAFNIHLAPGGASTEAGGAP
jgi:hypothetical protein